MGWILYYLASVHFHQCFCLLWFLSFPSLVLTLENRDLEIKDDDYITRIDMTIDEGNTDGTTFLVKWKGRLKTKNCIIKGISNFLRPFSLCLFSTVTVAYIHNRWKQVVECWVWNFFILVLKHADTCLLSTYGLTRLASILLCLNDLSASIST